MVCNRLQKHADGALQGLALDDFNAAEGSAVILEHIKRMVKTGKPLRQAQDLSRSKLRGKPHPLSEEMVAAVAVAEACRTAEKNDRPTRVQAR